MKDESDKRSEVVKFEDDTVSVIDGHTNLSISEMVGALELQLHVLKCRFYPPRTKSDGPPQSP